MAQAIRSEAIKDFSTYSVYEDGTIYNIHNRLKKPDRNGCVSIRKLDRRKTFYVARLVTITFLDMPDNKKYNAYKKDPNDGFETTNIAWDSLTHLNNDRLTKACDHTGATTREQFLKEMKEQLKEMKQSIKDLKQQLKREMVLYMK